MLDIALLYYSKGYNVLPIPKPGEKIGTIWDDTLKNADKVADGKSAKGYGQWSKWIDKKQSREDVIILFKDKVGCNIAVITGKVSHIIAFDIDGETAE